ncbi:PREDICTED: endophilin-A3-like [Galeopterus variegatus]|uniref:Endophilin-A3-like n=1 Tax=Galeopterus variegatus TaxID=482537 RepID=A0ABM0S5K9_GALVR|nr:PREDICTED: endophilin-A3-like [Galeopterus variegatus]
MKWTRAQADARLPCTAGSLLLVSSLWMLYRLWPPGSNFPLLLQVEQVSQLAVFIEAALDYHRQSTEILQELQTKLQIRISAASNIPKREYKPRPVKRSSSELNGVSTTSVAKTTGSNVPMDQPCCRGLYDFEPENQGELGFKEGDITTLTNRIDENWYEGMIHGESGFFPINYVEVIVPLPR